MSASAVLFLALAAGTVTGIALRRRQRALHMVNHAVAVSIFALLFLLGLSVGLNEDIMSSLGRLGGEALILSVASTAGSVILVYVLYRGIGIFR